MNPQLRITMEVVYGQLRYYLIFPSFIGRHNQARTYEHVVNEADQQILNYITD